MLNWTRRLVASALLAALCVTPGWSAEADASLVVYLVRHAEKAGEKGDVPLAEAGTERALNLAKMLADVPVAGVHSTDTLRTRSTGQPTAAAHDSQVQLYDPRAPDELVAQLKKSGGHHLVVGHSNTVGGLVEALGGQPGVTIRDDEYDRLYIVVVNGDAPVSTSLLRY